MEKSCTESEPLEEGPGFILYGITLWVVQVGLVRMVAKAPIHQPEPVRKILSCDNSSGNSDADYDSVSEEVVDLGSADEGTPPITPLPGELLEPQSVEIPTLEPSLMKLPPEDSHPIDCLSVESLPVEPSPTETPLEASHPAETAPPATTTPLTEPTATPNPPQKPRRVILRPARLKRLSPEAEVDPNTAFTSEEKDVLKRFVTTLSAQRHQLFAKSEFILPTIVPSLVSISSAYGSSQTIAATGTADATRDAITLIRIVGLNRWDEIRFFHKIMSRPENRHVFSPLDLCYHKERVRHTALEAACAIRDPAQARTLCGCLIVVQSSDLGQRTSTIGGLLSIRGKYHALTTSHAPDDEDEPTDNSVDDESDSDEGSLFIFDSGIDSDDSDSVTSFASDDDESARGETAGEIHETASMEEDTINDGAGSTREMRTKASTAEGESTAERSFADMIRAINASHITPEDLTTKEGYITCRIDEDRLRSGDDWLLVPVEANLLLRNKIPEGAGKPPMWQNPFIESYCPDLNQVFVDHHHPDAPPSQKTVWAVSGMNGLRPLVVVWCPETQPFPKHCNNGHFANLDLAGFQPGDSGSWIVDDKSRRVLGVLVARSSGVGYMVSFASIRQDIATTLRIRQTSVQLASRMNPLLRSRGSSTGRVIRSFSPVRYARRAPAAQSWSQMLSGASAATLDVVRHPVDLGRNPSVIVLFIATVYMSLLWEIPSAWRSVTTLQNALVPPACALLFWALTELEMRRRPTTYSRHDRLAIRRTLCTWLCIALAAGLLASLGIYIVRGPASNPFTLRSNGQRVSDQSIRDFSDAMERLRRSDPQARYNAFEDDLRELNLALRRLDFRAVYYKLKDMVLRKFSKHKWLRQL
ncbi:hypothetical protein CSIM01_10774 [Colletotrichum simmondsii]|uniref:Uncharacterized protein n=1 Tax=Colletotrichum simmondsii TaxID=703756 RepID=A0A135TUN0_9PEZI|nr:hypothetical protein CSIM01_10774 [Colletotrichum simmondsii]